MCIDEFVVQTSSQVCRDGTTKRYFTPGGLEGGPAWSTQSGNYIQEPHEGIRALIEGLKGTLLAAGWTLEESYKASGSLYVPGWFVTWRPLIFEGVQAENDRCGCLHDCGSGIVDFGTVGECWNLAKCCCGDCSKCKDPDEPFGDFTGTLVSLAAALNSCFCQPFAAQGYCFSPQDDGLGLRVESLKAGPEWNLPYFQTAVGVGFAQAGGPELSIGGGGYRLRSQRANDRTQYDLKITMPAGNAVLSIEAIELLAGTKVQYLLRTGLNVGGGIPNVPLYQIVANPYQLAIIDLANPADSSGSFSFGGNSFLSSAFWTDDASILYGLAVIGPGMIQNATTWGGFPCSFAVNGPFRTYNPSPFNPAPNQAGLATNIYSFNQPLVTSNGKPIISNPWLSLAPDRSTEARIVGKFWDALAISQAYPFGAKLAYGNYDWAQISRQTGATVSSLWFALGDNQKVEDLPPCS